MRVWDLPVEKLCDRHLLAQHNEIHAIYSIIMNDKKGFANHPEVTRWYGRISSLEWAHHITAEEMVARKFNHNSPMEISCPIFFWPESWQPVYQQIELLKEKSKTIPRCDCYERLLDERHTETLKDLAQQINNRFFMLPEPHRPEQLEMKPIEIITENRDGALVITFKQAVIPVYDLTKRQLNDAILSIQPKTKENKKEE